MPEMHENIKQPFRMESQEESRAQIDRSNIEMMGETLKRKKADEGSGHSGVTFHGRGPGMQSWKSVERKEH